MDFLSTVGVQELNGFAELSASYNAVVDKQELFTLDKLVNGNKLHLCNLVSHGLALRHEAAGPCGGVLYKWACERNAASVCVTDCVRNAGGSGQEPGILHRKICRKISLKNPFHFTISFIIFQLISKILLYFLSYFLSGSSPCNTFLWI